MAEIPIQVLLIVGSTERSSYARTNLEILADLLRERGAVTHFWDLASDPLPIFNPIYHLDPSRNESEAVRRLAQLADNADAFAWASPVYHNSYSGVLKNALDSLTSRQFRNKPVALLSSGSNERTGVQPCDHLRLVTCSLLAVAIPTQIVTLPSDFERFQGHHQLINTTVHKRFIRMADELLAYTTVMSQVEQNVSHIGY